MLWIEPVRDDVSFMTNIEGAVQRDVLTVWVTKCQKAALARPANMTLRKATVGTPSRSTSSDTKAFKIKAIRRERLVVNCPRFPSRNEELFALRRRMV